MLTTFQYVVEQTAGYHVASSAKPGKFCHVARGHVFQQGTCRKLDVGQLGAVWLENGTRQEHQMSAVDKWMSQASRSRGHVAHVLLYVRPQGVIFVLNVTNT